MRTRQSPQHPTGPYRVGSALLGVALWMFGVLGFARQLSFFSTQGAPVLGTSTNGLLSGISMVVGVALVGAAIRGGRIGSMISAVVGGLFLLSGVAHLIVLDSSLNVLSFRMSNVVFSLVAGAILLSLGAYARLAGGRTGNEPHRDEYTHDAIPYDAGDRSQMLPEGRVEVAATVEMAEAERAVAAGAGTAEQRRGIASMNRHRDTDDRRAAWRGLSRAGDASE